ncbi:(2Fe-2S)-binding protein [Methylobacterium nonmethylotrophicum]|uniref:2Fe-2S iron-sulfur cluster binding domain-containing protein n=1 Tax=Methylobacterium nonmethylotrophicum TaxID=1141884 RepID=A0A4Z0NHK9_9HYPH|nr:2Fe-2S iron-sulfur cluster-binding protein [Methylobacterium nonmethylotrophicum]TGD95256.1 2Fe-2S iron-sulfur cluster binding domain-containing protein [Methylobacterium nonmethylotrophicum]
METARFFLNGEPRSLTVEDPDEPLLYVLRDRLGLRATRYGCGQGLCGSCTVIVDGRAARACDLPLWSIEGRDVVTPDAGDAVSPVLGRVRAALAAERAGQCGYCLPGIAMSLAALFAAEPAPTGAAIRAALARNLCRCGAHPRVLRAIARLEHS